MARVMAVCISEKRGTQKKNIGECEVVEGYGLKDDAHGGNWHRQVSLLSYEKVEEFRKRGADVSDGAFGENILVSGIDFKTLPIGTVFRCGEVVLVLTQVGKKCHSECNIYHMVGDCIMPREGVFTKVLHGGVVKVGDEFVIEKMGEDLRHPVAAVLTLSDKGSKGERVDESGMYLCDELVKLGYEIGAYDVISDDYDEIVKKLLYYADFLDADLVLTTGGTGFSQRDNTPEATRKVIKREAPGISEAIRAYSMTKTKRAMLSRGVSGIRNNTLIINFPGSKKACIESLEVIADTLPHAIGILRGEEGECGRSDKK
ncbi:MAG: MOSC domain-containing protein [Lachnospiraceae bacterium]|nr:MOSC domain-containing protein [Lachnospiraceae bacterium]